MPDASMVASVPRRGLPGPAGLLPAGSLACAALGHVAAGAEPGAAGVAAIVLSLLILILLNPVHRSEIRSPPRPAKSCFWWIARRAWA